jgi:PIN domain nuclease of toxin-antitoxin system
MRYLIDTHVVIWMAEDSEKLPPKMKKILEDEENKIYLCTISLWEIAIKMNLGKLDLGVRLDEFFINIEQRDFSILHIENDYLNALSDLPYIHKDPFDRLLISTALTENLTIMTIDENIQQYDVAWVW